MCRSVQYRQRQQAGQTAPSARYHLLHKQVQLSSGHNSQSTVDNLKAHSKCNRADNIHRNCVSSSPIQPDETKHAHVHTHPCTRTSEKEGVTACAHKGQAACSPDSNPKSCSDQAIKVPTSHMQSTRHTRDHTFFVLC